MIIIILFFVIINHFDIKSNNWTLGSCHSKSKLAVIFYKLIKNQGFHCQFLTWIQLNTHYFPKITMNFKYLHKRRDVPRLHIYSHGDCARGRVINGDLLVSWSRSREWSSWRGNLLIFRRSNWPEVWHFVLPAGICWSEHLTPANTADATYELLISPRAGGCGINKDTFTKEMDCK